MPKINREKFVVFCRSDIFRRRLSNHTTKMDQESNQMEQQSSLCRNGCGFYSNNGTDGLCSVCYKDMIKKKQQPPTNLPATLAPTPGAMASLSIDEESSTSSLSPAKTSNSVDTALPTVILPSSQTDKVKILIKNLENFVLDF